MVSRILQLLASRLCHKSLPLREGEGERERGREGEREAYLKSKKTAKRIAMMQIFVFLFPSSRSYIVCW